MNSERDDNLAGGLPNTRHSLADWLALHELDQVTCCDILDAMTREASCVSAAHKRLKSGCQPIDLRVGWLTTVQALGDYFSRQRAIIDDTFENTMKIVVERRGQSPRALTVDNGPTGYPTILFSYGGEPSDTLVMAHEFGHALQIRASGGKFVPPLMREVCAFLAEAALLTYTRQHDASRYAELARVWHKDNRRYFGSQSDRLRAALLRPEAPYRYSWNYPIARYFAIQIAERCSRDWIWRLFEGGISAPGVLRALAHFSG